MPKGPRGERRPADVIGAAVMVAKIATGEIEDERRDPGKELHTSQIPRARSMRRLISRLAFGFVDGVERQPT
jgi:hypothetical protein